MFQTVEVSKCVKGAKGRVSDWKYWMRYDINIGVTVKRKRKEVSLTVELSHMCELEEWRV